MRDFRKMGYIRIFDDSNLSVSIRCRDSETLLLIYLSKSMYDKLKKYTKIADNIYIEGDVDIDGNLFASHISFLKSQSAIDEIERNTNNGVK